MEWSRGEPYDQSDDEGSETEAAESDAPPQGVRLFGRAARAGYLRTPFETEMLGVTVRVEKIDLLDDDSIVAVCRRGQHRQTVPLLDLPMPRARSGSRRTGDGGGEDGRACADSPYVFDVGAVRVNCQGINVATSANAALSNPTIAGCFRAMNDRRNHLPPSHPYDRKTGAKTALLKSQERNRFVGLLKAAFAEVATLMP